jgi:hypothetical protein
MKSWLLVAICLAGGLLPLGSFPPQGAGAAFSPHVLHRCRGTGGGKGTVRFRGNANFPPGAKSAVQVSKFSGYGWEYYSESVCVPLAAFGWRCLKLSSAWLVGWSQWVDATLC